MGWKEVRVRDRREGVDSGNEVGGGRGEGLGPWWRGKRERGKVFRLAGGRKEGASSLVEGKKGRGLEAC